METCETKNGKNKTTDIYFFHLKFVKMKKIFTIFALKQPNSRTHLRIIQIFEKIIDKDWFT